MPLSVQKTTCVQEEDHDDPLRLDQRTPGNLDGPQVHRNHVKPGEGCPKQNYISKQIHYW